MASPNFAHQNIADFSVLCVFLEMGKNKKGKIAGTVSYPPYCIKWIGGKHFLVGGGGGGAKTGVPNKFVSQESGYFF